MGRWCPGFAQRDAAAGDHCNRAPCSWGARGRFTGCAVLAARLAGGRAGRGVRGEEWAGEEEAGGRWRIAVNPPGT